MQAEGDAAAIVRNRDRAVAMLDQVDFLAETGQSLVGSVVDDLLIVCSGLPVRVYMPGRCLTGSRPLSTRIEPSP